MHEYNPCMGCEYYNKPYWSVVSPCKSCPRVYGTENYITTNTTNIKKLDGYTSLNLIIDDITAEEIEEYMKSTTKKMITDYVKRYET